MLSKWLLSSGLLASRAAGLTIQPTNNSQTSTDVELIVGGQNFGNVQPLTSSASANLNVNALFTHN
jgi:hypothetical protein